MKTEKCMKEPQGMFFVKGEPEIVTETRRKILRAFEDLEFYEEGHRYFLHGKSLPSVSGIGARFIVRPFDEQKQAERFAVKNGETAEYWLREWHKKNFRATSLGSRTHAFAESMGYLRAGLPEMIVPEIRKQYHEEYQYLAPLHPKEEAAEEFFQDLPPSMHLVLNEAKVYSGKNPDNERNLKEQICGTFDMLYYYDGAGDETQACFYLMDYKTNGHLTNDYNQQHHVTLKKPFDNMIEEDTSLYAIQLSLYALMLEDIGVKVKHRVLIWLKGDEEPGTKDQGSGTKDENSNSNSNEQHRKYQAIRLEDLSELLRATL